GCALGYIAQEALAIAVAEVVKAELPAPRVLPAVQGFLVGLVLLLGFALPPRVRGAEGERARGLCGRSAVARGAAHLAGRRSEARPDRGGRFCRGDRRV